MVFFRGLVRGAVPAYLLSGLELEAISRSKVTDPASGRHDTTEVVLATVERLGEAMEADGGADYWRPHLWRLCGEHPGLVDVLELPAFRVLAPEAAFWLLRLAASPHWSQDAAQAQWAELAPWLKVIAARAVELPCEFQRKFIEAVAGIYMSAMDDDEDVAQVVGDGIALGPRVARRPFSTRAVLGTVLVPLVQADWNDRRHLDALREAPDSSWIALEGACRRDNDATLIGWGFARLARVDPELLARGFAGKPKALFRTATLLAAVSSEVAVQLLAAHRESRLADARTVDAPVERLCELIEPVARAGGPDPIRRVLRQHLAGERVLSAAQVSGHRARLVADLDLVRLAAIRQAVERHLASRAGTESIASPAALHALVMLDGAGLNRRQLRRLITAAFGGDPEWRLRHPLSRSWFARHPRLSQSAWLAGMDLRGQIDGIGAVRICVESDPLEALKVGTYVGSCLGRGGGLSYSAAAVVLDVNKHVVYARDAPGSIIGRQLLAISEADELVCFEVYGNASPARLEPLFRRFDQAFASRLAVPLFASTPGSGDYEIASILSHEWWDDGAWDGAVPAG